jgi:flagellar basal-body rod modification protein FlgD
MIQSVGEAASRATVGPEAAPLAEETTETTSTPTGNETINQQEFLMLFISQLQHQDPLNPLDANGLTEQLAQFSSLEQLFTINTNLEALRTELTDREAGDPLRFLDREVTVTGDTVTITDGTASGLIADVPTGAFDLEAEILAPNGVVLRTLGLGTPPAGELEIVFDGTQAQGGALADGSYQVRVTGRDADGAPVPVPTLVRERVTGVDLAAEPPVLLLGTRRVPLADVRSIRSAVATDEEG